MFYSYSRFDAMTSDDGAIFNEQLEEISTVDLLAELKRRFRVLHRPEASVVIIGDSGIAEQSRLIRAEFGLCGIDGEQVKAASTDTMETLKKISAEIQQPRCRRGFVLRGFPSTLEEAQSFDKMLQVDVPDKPVFSDYHVIQLVKQEDQSDVSAASSALNGWPRFNNRLQIDASKSTEEKFKHIFSFLSVAKKP